MVDGGSTDDTLEILQQYQPTVTWISEPDNGQADALNKGFRLARGEIIGWLNADDTYEPGTIQAAVAYLQAHPTVDLVYGNFNFIDEQERVIHSHTTPEFTLEKLLYAAIIPQAGMFFRRKIIDQVGGVNPDLHYILDWEFSLRVARRYNVARIAQTWGNFRIVRGTKSVQQPEQFWPEFISVLQRTFKEEPHRFKPWASDAQFMANLLAGLEFARANQQVQAQSYVDRAFTFERSAQRHPAVLASGLYQAAARPWHAAFKFHPEADQALNNLSCCLSGSLEKRQLLGYLHLRRALNSLRRGQGAEHDVAFYRWPVAH